MKFNLAEGVRTLLNTVFNRNIAEDATDVELNDELKKEISALNEKVKGAEDLQAELTSANEVTGALAATVSSLETTVKEMGETLASIQKTIADNATAASSNFDNLKEDFSKQLNEIKTGVNQKATNEPITSTENKEGDTKEVTFDKEVWNVKPVRVVSN